MRFFPAYIWKARCKWGACVHVWAWLKECVKGLIDPGYDCRRGMLTCSVSVPFTSAAASLLFYQGFVERSVSISVIEDAAVDLCVCKRSFPVSFESLRSVATFLGAVKSSSAWVNDDRDDDSLYSRAPQVATPAWLRATSAPTFLSCVRFLLPGSLSLYLSLFFSGYGAFRTANSCHLHRASRGLIHKQPLHTQMLQLCRQSEDLGLKGPPSK